MKAKYTIPIKDLQRLIKQDHSDKFYLLVKSSSNENDQITIETTINKARVISNKINQLYQTDPTIDEYEIIIPDENSSSTDLNLYQEMIFLLLRSSTEEIELDTEKVYLFNKIHFLLGQNEEERQKTDFQISNLKEALSLLRTEFHDKSIEYISSHFSEFSESYEFSSLDDEIVIEIIDSFFLTKDEKKFDEMKKIFENLTKKEKDNRIIMHFLLSIEHEEYDIEMIEYITSHLSDEVVQNDITKIIEKFKRQLLSQPIKKKKNVIKCQFEGNELSGIFSCLKKKFGDGIVESGTIKLTDFLGTGVLSNLIKNDNSEYHSQGAGVTEPSDGWFEIDFGERKINLESYTLRSCSKGQYSYPKSWRIVGSNDRTRWDVLDHQTDNGSLHGNYLQKRFVCEDNNNNEYYQYIRFIQEDSWNSGFRYNIILSRLELFGTILDCD